ncbi:MAG: hypothetical protein ABI893_06700, partial [Polaromonas sp.]
VQPSAGAPQRDSAGIARAQGQPGQVISKARSPQLMEKLRDYKTENTPFASLPSQAVNRIIIELTRGKMSVGESVQRLARL